MNVKWTKDLLDQVRAHAAQGHSMKRAAVLLNVPETTLATYASIHRISFHGPRAPGRWTEALLDKVRAYAADGHTQRRTAELLNISRGSLAVYASRHDIRFHGRPTGGRKIAGAVGERSSAPGYKPPGPLVW